MTHVYQTSSKNIDGHFWLEVEGVTIIDPTPFPNKPPYNITPKYYKKASESIQKLAIEMLYRKYEASAGCSRDSDEWVYYLMSHEYQLGACFHNVLKFKDNTRQKVKIVFGYVGVYHNQATRMYPKNSVYWLYGCTKYSNIKDLFKGNLSKPEDYWTYENWDDRDNKAVIGFQSK